MVVPGNLDPGLLSVSEHASLVVEHRSCRVVLSSILAGRPSHDYDWGGRRGAIENLGGHSSEENRLGVESESPRTVQRRPDEFRRRKTAPIGEV